MQIPKDNAKLEAAKELRRKMTPHERKLWYLFLRNYPNREITWNFKKVCEQLDILLKDRSTQEK